MTKLNLTDLDPHIAQMLYDDSPELRRELNQELLDQLKRSNVKHDKTMAMLQSLEDRSAIQKGHLREAILARIKIQMEIESRPPPKKYHWLIAWWLR